MARFVSNRRRSDLLSYFAKVDPAIETEDRLRLAARIGRLCEIMDAYRGEVVDLTAGELRLVRSALASLNDALLNHRHDASLAGDIADDLVARVRERVVKDV